MRALLNEGMNRQLATNYIPDDGSYFSCSIAWIYTQFQQRRYEAIYYQPASDVTLLQAPIHLSHLVGATLLV